MKAFFITIFLISLMSTGNTQTNSCTNEFKNKLGKEINESNQRHSNFKSASYRAVSLIEDLLQQANSEKSLDCSKLTRLNSEITTIRALLLIERFKNSNLSFGNYFEKDSINRNNVRLKFLEKDFAKISLIKKFSSKCSTGGQGQTIRTSLYKELKGEISNTKQNIERDILYIGGVFSSVRSTWQSQIKKLDRVCQKKAIKICIDCNTKQKISYSRTLSK